MVRDKYIKSAEFFDSLSTASKLTVLLLIGVGNYRSVIFLIIFFCIKAVVDYEKKHNYLKILLMPVLILTIYYDVAYGQIWFQNKYNIALFLILLIIIDHTATSTLNALVEKISVGNVFSYCPDCKYENKKLTIKCSYCGHEGNRTYAYQQSFNNIYDKSFHFQFPKLKYNLKSGVIADLSLAENEHVYMSVKVGFGDGPRIDGNKHLCSHVIITNQNIILMHKFLFQRGWRWLAKISLNDIKEIVMVDQNITSSARQSIKLSTESNTYELFLWTLYKQKNEFQKYYDAINQHILKMQSA